MDVSQAVRKLISPPPQTKAEVESAMQNYVSYKGILKQESLKQAVEAKEKLWKQAEELMQSSSDWDPEKMDYMDLETFDTLQDLSDEKKAAALEAINQARPLMEFIDFATRYREEDYHTTQQASNEILARKHNQKEN